MTTGCCKCNVKKDMFSLFVFIFFDKIYLKLDKILGIFTVTKVNNG